MPNCQGCGKPLEGEGLRDIATFHSTACRQEFNNRRAVRGAALYDLWMAHRYQRPLAKVVGCFALMCALGQQYREEDIRRTGHEVISWLDPHEVMRRKPWLRAKVSQLTSRRSSKGSA